MLFRLNNFRILFPQDHSGDIQITSTASGFPREGWKWCWSWIYSSWKHAQERPVDDEILPLFPLHFLAQCLGHNEHSIDVCRSHAGLILWMTTVFLSMNFLGCLKFISTSAAKVITSPCCIFWQTIYSLPWPQVSFPVDQNVLAKYSLCTTHWAWHCKVMLGTDFDNRSFENFRLKENR